MGQIFSASEIVQIAVKIERNGRDFYTYVAGKSGKDKAKDVFRYLAEEEEKHIRVFTDLLASFEKYEPAEAYPDEYFAYLKALSDGYVFTKENRGKEMAEGIRDEMEAIDLGIGVEKDSILLYLEMKNLVPEEGRAIIDRVLEEERGHLRKLSEIKRGFQMWSD